MQRLLLLSILVYVLLLLGLAGRSSGLLALALPLVAYLGGALLRRPDKPRLRITRTLGRDRVSEDVPVTVTLLVANEGPRIEEILLQDHVPPGLDVRDGESELLTSLSPGGSVELAYTVCGKRGEYRYTSTRVTLAERFGLLRQWADLPVPGRLLILPQTQELRRVTIRPLRTRGYAGPIPARQGGSGVEFFGVREYQSGDPLRWINWRKGVRHPHALYTNQFEQERIADVGLILDARRRSDVRSRGDSLFEHSVRAAASLAEAFLGDGNRVGLLIYGRYLQWTFPGYGRLQHERMQQALAQAETGASMVFGSLDYLPTRYFPARSQLVLVSPLCWEDLRPLLRLRARGYQLLVISPDPIGFEVSAFESGPEVTLAARIAYLERTLLFRRLHRAGVRTVDWQVERPFDQVLRVSLSRLPHWFRAVGVQV